MKILAFVIKLYLHLNYASYITIFLGTLILELQLDGKCSDIIVVCPLYYAFNLYLDNNNTT